MMRLPRLFRRRDREQRLDEEIRFHVDMQTEKNVRAGMAPADAHAAALRSYARAVRRKRMDHRGASRARDTSATTRRAFA